MVKNQKIYKCKGCNILKMGWPTKMDDTLYDFNGAVDEIAARQGLESITTGDKRKIEFLLQSICEYAEIKDPEDPSIKYRLEPARVQGDTCISVELFRAIDGSLKQIPGLYLISGQNIIANSSYSPRSNQDRQWPGYCGAE